MSFPLDIFPIMSHITELRERAENAGATCDEDAALMSPPPPRCPVSIQPSFSTPVTSIGKALKKSKRGARLVEKIRMKRSDLTAVDACSTEPSSARNIRENCDGDCHESWSMTSAQPGSPLMQSNAMVEPIEGSNTARDERSTEAAQGNGVTSEEQESLEWTMPHRDLEDVDITALPPMPATTGFQVPAKQETEKLKKRMRGPAGCRYHT